MGFIRKVTGQQAQMDAAQRAADQQAASLKASSEQAAKVARDSAQQAATAQAAAAARNAAVGAASDALEVPLDNPDVQLSGPAPVSAGETARKRKATFGVGANTGVNI